MKAIFFFMTLFLPLVCFSQEELICSKLQGLERMKIQMHARIQDSRLSNYDVTFYHINLAADNLSTHLEGSATIVAFTTIAEMTEFVLQLAVELNISAVTVNGTSHTFTHTNDLIVIPLIQPLTSGEKAEVTIFYSGTPPTDDGFFSGISQDLGPFDIPVTWTLSEPFNASDWFPVKQVLTDQADSANIYITVPDHLMAGAPGVLKNKVPVANNRIRFEWETRYPMAYYLLSMAIAPYREILQSATLPGNAGSVPVLNYIYDDNRVEQDVIASLEDVPPMITLFSELFGQYPFSEEKYGHTMAPMGGGMEHQTMSTMAGFNFTLNAHELMHQWFGDDITCATWQDIWINEGFARYGEYVAIENLRSKQEADNWMEGIYNNIISNPTGSVYVPVEEAEDPYRIFNLRLTYNKGGALLHMLRSVINDDPLFFKAMRDYSENFSGGLATGDDFRQSMESSTGISFSNFFEEWYYGQGYPIYSFHWAYDEGKLSINMDQTTSAPEVTPFFSTPIPVVVQTASGLEELRLAPQSNIESFVFPFEEEVLSVTFDPENKIVKRLNTVTAIDPSQDVGFSIYPNPAKSSFYIAISSGRSYQFILTDLQGKLIHTRTLNDGAIHRIPVEFLPSGMYIVQMINDLGEWTRRVEIIR